MNDRTRIRVGLVLLSIVVIVAIVMLFAVEAPAGRAVMFAIALTAFVRAFLLVRNVSAGRGATTD